MNSIRVIHIHEYPELLKEISDPPDVLYVRGTLPPPHHILLTIVGSRKYSSYGKQLCETLIPYLQGLPVTIVSGLAYGIDSIAHEVALLHNIHTVAIPGSGISDNMIYPRAHVGLAHKILGAGGALLSPFAETTLGNKWTFPVRNRVMAGMSHAVLVIEAQSKSGTLITAHHAIEFNRDVLTVPGSVYSPLSAGPHQLIKTGATPITHGDDLVRALGFAPLKNTDSEEEKRVSYEKLSPDEQTVLKLLEIPLPRDELYSRLDMEVAHISVLLSTLEIKGLISERLGEIWRT